MKLFFTILTIGFIIVGFLTPLGWIGALITGIVAIGCAPAGKRPDGKAKTGGLLGSIWDNYQVSKSMTDCPFCRSKIMKEASKCPTCGEWIEELESATQAPYEQKSSIGPQSQKEVRHKIGFLEIIILILVGLIFIAFIVGKLGL